ncbi:sensor histidine kinase [Paenibacillus sp. WLX1005]|uniref:cache domain-containing sensor histidine kinase n=1 Tax=Paenibacillus sp. WLX1005 TaxID=3243766 RepID=UPI003984415C
MNIRQWFTSSIFIKFSTSFILVGLIPLFALSYLSVQIFSSYVERYTTGNLQQMSLYMSYNLNSAFQQYNDISKLMYSNRYNNELGDTASENQAYNVNELEQINSIPIDSFLKTIVFSDPYIRSAYFVRASDDRLYDQERENRGLQTELLPYQQWQQKMVEQPSKIAIFPTHQANYFTGSRQQVFTMARNLIDTSGRMSAEPKVVGTLFIDIDTKMFNPFLGDLYVSGKNEIALVDNQGHVYFGNQDSQQLASLRSADPDGDMLVLKEDIPFLNGQLIVGIHRAGLFEQLFAARTTVYIAILICSLALIIMGTWFSRRLAAPIRRLIRQMAIVESGQLDIRLPVESNDEMGRLAQSFNRMVERLQIYIDEAYIAQIKQKQTELNALKSQIRPHYLYNTLEVIRMNAVDKEADEVADMIHSLSNQLKYVIDYGEEQVTLAAELAHLRDYFYLISVRYDNRYVLRCDIDSDVDMNWSILKLSLQPIVENAIQHGLRQQKKGTVGIHIRQKDHMLIITLHDDGIGMKPDTLAELTQSLRQTSSTGKLAKSVGLKNVHERMCSTYGEYYGLSIRSQLGIGTSVELYFPEAPAASLCQQEPSPVRSSDSA